MFCLIEKFSFTLCRYKFFMIYVQIYVYYKRKNENVAYYWLTLLVL